MILILNSQGVLVDGNTSDYIMQGSDGVNELYVAYPDYDSATHTCKAVFTPNGGTALNYNLVLATFDFKGRTYNGYKVNGGLDSFITGSAGALSINVVLYDSNNSALVSYTFSKTVNATGISAWDSTINKAEYQNLVAQLLYLQSQSLIDIHNLHTTSSIPTSQTTPALSSYAVNSKVLVLDKDNPSAWKIYNATDSDSDNVVDTMTELELEPYKTINLGERTIRQAVTLMTDENKIYRFKTTNAVSGKSIAYGFKSEIRNTQVPYSYNEWTVIMGGKVYTYDENAANTQSKSVVADQFDRVYGVLHYYKGNSVQSYAELQSKSDLETQAHTITGQYKFDTTPKATNDPSDLNDLARKNYVDNKVSAVNDSLTAETTNRQNADATLQTNIDNINAKIPSEASSSNKLADKDFVNSSIATSTATFRGTSATGLTEAQFLTWANGLTKDKNDYVYWDTVDSVGNRQFKKYTYTGSEWLYEYTLNNSSFTAQQWAAIQSGITSTKVAEYDDTVEDVEDILDGTKTVANATNAGHATTADSATTATTADSATTATKATQDQDGNPIKTTYVKTINNVSPTNGNVDVAGFMVVDKYNAETGKININSTGLTMSYDESTGILTVI